MTSDKLKHLRAGDYNIFHVFSVLNIFLAFFVAQNVYKEFCDNRLLGKWADSAGVPYTEERLKAKEPADEILWGEFACFVEVATVVFYFLFLKFT